jgi:OOP family OmpA-OmpF porin
MMRHAFATGFCALLFVGAALVPMTVHAADVPGGKDYPLVGRYEGSDLVGYRAKEFDEVKVVAGPFTAVGAAEQTGEGFQTLEGREILIYYKLPEGRSALEAFRNYETALKGKGFSVLFGCNAADGSCFVGKSQEAPYLIGAALGGANSLPRLVDDYPHNWFDQKARYILARSDTPAGAVYASISLGESARGTVAVVRIVETKQMEADKIVVLSASEMGEALDKDGRVNIYSLHFDFDKDTLRPESKPTLDEIAKLLTDKPDLKLQIVGHTDNKGTADYNMDLSGRRAGNVVGALTEGHDIDEGRLSWTGKGFNEPVASNDTEDGRAKNRRVELVAQ